MKKDRLAEMDEKLLKQLIEVHRLIARNLLQRIASLKSFYGIKEKRKAAAAIDMGDGQMAYAPPQDSAQPEVTISSTDIHDLRKLKMFESELRTLAFDSGKEASHEYLRHMKKVIKTAAKFIEETEKKKEKRRREEEIKKYGKH